ncbi:Hypothetical predicted protein [Octopus vulgaris]|uniref:Uncharacterized protein n=1 Tax=Octopus vulgaris TaxID=6645 RepID=A0AA36B3V8_OCTVU|nr:Hypothetical predicted protein [Octopus vulgaris]
MDSVVSMNKKKKTSKKLDLFSDVNLTPQLMLLYRIKYFSSLPAIDFVLMLFLKVAGSYMVECSITKLILKLLMVLKAVFSHLVLRLVTVDLPAKKFTFEIWNVLERVLCVSHQYKHVFLYKFHHSLSECGRHLIYN